MAGMDLNDQLGGYELLSVLGHGANSTIYAVTDPKDSHVYAIKRVIVRSPSDQRFVDQALTEHEIAAKLDHPALRRSYRIIRRRKVLKTSELLVLMEFVDGQTMEQHRPQTLDKAIRLFAEAADGLAAMHRAGFVHCDIKPNNLMVTPDQQVKIIDFGQACAVNTTKKRIQGTPDYIAPEQVLRRAMTARTDVYNLGATMYWCFTRRHVPTLIPKGSDNGHPRRAELVPPSELNASLPKALNALILHCVQTEPTERPGTIAEVRDRLQIVLSQVDRSGETGVMPALNGGK